MRECSHSTIRAGWLVVGLLACLALAGPVAAEGHPDDTPYIEFDAPMNTSSNTQLAETYRTDTGRPWLNGTIHDDDGLASVQVTQTYVYQRQTYSDPRKTQTVEYEHNDGPKMNLKLALGHGENNFRIEVRDEAGNLRVYTFTLKNLERNPPRIVHRNRETISNREAVRLIFKDDTNIDWIRYQIGDARPQMVPVAESDRIFATHRRQELLLVTAGEDAHVTAQDRAGNRQQWRLSGEPSPTPDIEPKTPTPTPTPTATPNVAERRLDTPTPTPTPVPAQPTGATNGSAAGNDTVATPIPTTPTATPTPLPNRFEVRAVEPPGGTVPLAGAGLIILGAGFFALIYRWSYD